MAVVAWNWMGAEIRMDLMPWLVDYLGVEDFDAFMLDLITIRDWSHG